MTEIAILSGKGGTGKTSLSAAFATLENDVIVADCDVDASNLHLILDPANYHTENFVTGQKAFINRDTCDSCGLCMDYCRFDAIFFEKGQIRISVTACDGCMLCSRICPKQSISMIANDKSLWHAGFFRKGRLIYARLEPGEDNSGKLVNIVREKARTTARETGWETIIIDGPPGLGCPVISSMTGVNKAVVVAEPTNSGFHDMKRMLELTSGLKVNSCVVINKYDLNKKISGRINKWCRENNIPVIGKIPFDAVFVEAMVNCRSVTEWAPGSAISIEIKKIWDHINFKN